jgi:transposase
VQARNQAEIEAIIIFCLKTCCASQAIYKGRARIEQAVGKLKRFKRVALRCEKTKRNFAAIVALAAGFILVKSVHTA